MDISRIPKYDRTNADGMLFWFSEMAARNLIFHPVDAPAEIVGVEDGSPIFTDAECKEVESILSRMFAEHGNGVIDACYPFYMRRVGAPRALNS